MIKKPQSFPSLFGDLYDMLRQSHPLYKLADEIDWKKFDNAFEPLYCHDVTIRTKPPFSWRF